MKFLKFAVPELEGELAEAHDRIAMLEQRLARAEQRVRELETERDAQPVGMVRTVDASRFVRG